METYPQFTLTHLFYKEALKISRRKYVFFPKRFPKGKYVNLACGIL